MALSSMFARHAAARTTVVAAAAAVVRVQVPRRWASAGSCSGDDLSHLPRPNRDFPTLRASGAPFVDKTSGIADLLVHSGKQPAIVKRAFFARPPAFGKTLTLSTARAILAAGDLPPNVPGWRGYDKEADAGVLKGTRAYGRFKRGELGDLMSRPHFVVSLDLSGAPSGDKLAAFITAKLAVIAGDAFGPEMAAKVLRQPTVEAALLALIGAVPPEVPVAVLVDGYDAAIMHGVAATRWDAAYAAMEAVFLLMMASKNTAGDSRISHFIVSGVSRLPNLLRFCGTDNFADLTNDLRLSAAMDITEGNIHSNLQDYLACLAANEAGSLTGGDTNVAMAKLVRRFGGYCFDGATTCFNPRAVLLSLAQGRVNRAALDGASATTWLGLTPSTVVDSLAAEERVRDEFRNLETADLLAGRVRSLPLLLQSGLLTLAPPPAGWYRYGVPLTMRRKPLYVVPNESARNTLRNTLLEVHLSDEVWDAVSTQVATALATRDKELFGAACATLLRTAHWDDPASYPAATPEQVAAAEAKVLEREAGYARALYAALRFMPGAPDVQVLGGEFPAAVIIKFPKPEATWIIKVGSYRSPATLDHKVVQGMQHAAGDAGVEVCAVVVGGPAATA